MNIVTVTKYTFLEAIKSRVLYNVLFLGLALLLLVYIGSEFTFGVPEKIALNFGLGAIHLSSVFISIFFGATLLAKEVENRTIHIILSKPINRVQFLIGRLCGLFLTLTLNITLLSIITLSIYFFMGGEFKPLIPWSIGFVLVESFIILAVSVLFSLLTNQTLTVLFTIVVFISGHAMSASLLTRMGQNSPLFNTLLKGYSYIFPNLSKLNIRDFVLYDQYLPDNFLSLGITYGIIYLAMMMFVVSIIFKNKNLD